MGGVHNEYQRPTDKEKRASAGKAPVCGARSSLLSAPEAIAAAVRVASPEKEPGTD